MRTIKFRGRTINEGEWIYGMTISRGTISRKKNNIFMEVSEGKWKGVIPETLTQFTGLRDSKGTEIYEGDIVRIRIWPTEATAEIHKRNAELAGVKIPSWIDGGGTIARVSYFDGAFHFIHLRSSLPACGGGTQEPMLSYLYYERHPDETAPYNQEITVIGNVFDNPEMLKGGTK